MGSGEKGPSWIGSSIVPGVSLDRCSFGATESFDRWLSVSQVHKLLPPECSASPNYNYV